MNGGFDHGRRLLHWHDLYHGPVLNTVTKDGVRLPAGLRPAAPDDLDAVLTMLRAAKLPTVGVATSFGDFVVATRAGAVVGAGGLDITGSHALFRSLVVDEGERGAGGRVRRGAGRADGTVPAGLQHR